MNTSTQQCRFDESEWDFSEHDIYVDGCAFIVSPYFRYLDAGAGFVEQPHDTLLIKCNKTIENHSYLYVEDKSKSPSIFNKYYAKEEFTTTCDYAICFTNSFQDNYNDYCTRIKDLKDLLAIPNLTESQQNKLYSSIYALVVAAVDTFFSDTVLTYIVKNKHNFLSYFQSIYIKEMSDCRKEELINELKNMWSCTEMGRVEKDVIKYVFKTSFANLGRMKETCDLILNTSFAIPYKEKMNRYFLNRHLIVHRMGRDKMGNVLQFSKNDINELISDMNNFVSLFMHSLMKGEKLDSSHLNWDIGETGYIKN
jgi:hypothetical protein